MKKFNSFETQLGESVVLTDKAKLSLYKKSQNSGYSVDILEEVYRRGYQCWSESFGGNPDSFAFDRVNSFISGGFAEMLDEDLVNEKRGLWDNIHAKRARIKAGSGERMRKPGSKGAPTDAALKASQNEDSDPCWKGYQQIGMKMKNGKKVPNCVPVKEEDAEAHSTDSNDPASRFVGSNELVDVYKKQTPGQIIKRVVREAIEIVDAMDELEEDWQDKKYKNPEGGLTKAGVMAYRRENPGSKLQTAVTTKPSKLKKGSKAYNRRKSFCARMGGMKKRLTSAKTANDPDSRINKALRKWNCEERIYEVAMAMPPAVQPPAVVGQQVPGVKRQAPRPTETSGRTGGRMAGQSGSMSARPNVRVSSGVQPSIERSWSRPGSARMGSGGGSMSASPTKVGTSFSQGGVNVGKGMAASKQTSPVVKGMTSAGREAASVVSKAAPTVAKGLGTAARIAGGPAATAAMAVMSPTPAGAGEDEKKRQETLKSYNPYKSSGRSVSDYEKQTLTPQKYDTPKPPAPKVDAPTPPSRPEYFSRGQAFQAARSEKGGAGGQFSYGGKEYQTNVAGEKYVSKPTTTSVKDESESGKKKK
jgi:hypothetical protein